MINRIYIPLSAKIYGICLLMLSLLIVVATGNYLRMTIIKEEVQDVAEFISPINKQVTLIYAHVLEQEIAFERMLRLIQERPENTSAIEQQQGQILQLAEVIQTQIRETRVLSEQATGETQIKEDIIALARLSPELRMLAEDHLEFATLYESLVKAIKQQQLAKSRLLDERLERLETIFNNRIDRLLHELVTITETSVAKIQAQDKALLYFNLLLSIIATICGIVLAALISKRVVRPLKALISGTDALLAENYQHQIAISSHDEISELTHSFNQLMRDVDKKETLRASMQEYLDPRVIKLLTEYPQYLKGTRQQASVLFSDIAHFSKLSETLSPESLVAVINEYYNLAGNAILQIDGVVDKYIGDAIVAFWSAPFTEPSGIARLACRGALKQLDQLNHLRLNLPDLVGIRKGLPDINIRIGIATGEIVVGNVGTRQSRSFTIIGESLNIAEQLEQMNKQLGTQILVTEATKVRAGDEFMFRLAGQLPPEDETDNAPPARVYNLLGYKEAFTEQHIAALQQADSAVVAYLNDDLETAKAGFEEFLSKIPKDNLCEYYLDCIARAK
ncbi:adenylate cyclase [Planctobacterium marinum]|uniref:Adenylate cyclase n=2 Tax=Planctobacterium marinum TaxID=1631968 RepID=A0AA48HSI0_9ALTE|nr:adenylate cyclase [Planctobacterium marinum]